MNDLKFALRQLLKNPGFTAVTVVSLALGIGVNSLVFSLVNALLLRAPAGVLEPDRLVSIWSRDGARAASGENARQWSYLDYSYYRDQSRSFSGLLAYGSDGVHASWSRGGEAEMRYGQLVSGNYFSVLGIQAAVGRTFLPEEDRTPGAHPVVVLSHNFWTRHLSGDPNSIGSTIVLNGRSFTMVGVAPEGFSGLLPGFGSDFWIPLQMAEQLGAGRLIENQSSLWLFVAGRMQPGVTISQARADLATLASRLEQANPDTHKSQGVIAVPMTLVPVMARRYVIAAGAILMTAVGLVLLIACANAANVFLAQASVRTREMAVRTALGAGRARLIRQVLTESTLLALLGGVAGLLLALWITPLLMRLKPPTVPITFDVPIDAQVVGFNFGLALLTGSILGLVPALRGSKFDVAANLKEGLQGGGREKSRLRNALVIGQVAVGLVLLICAGLCVRSLGNAHSIDIGFNPKNALTAAFDLRTADYDEVRGRVFYRQLLERIEALPGVQSASLANHLPLGPSFMGVGVAIAGHEPLAGANAIHTGVRFVGPKYFQAMGTPLIQGRSFTEQETDSAANVVIINDTMARRFWPNQDPLGKRIDLLEGDRKSVEIVGVAKTGKYRSLGEEPRLLMYLPFSFMARATLAARTTGDPRPLLAAVRQAVHRLDPNLALVQVGTLEEHMALPLFAARASGTLFGALGLLALVLALVGLYGVLAFFVTQRTREIGIRMALGADRGEVLKLVMRHGLTLTLIGVGIGLAGALAVTRVFTSLLYGIRPIDPLTYLCVSLLLVGVSALATFIPARRASKVDPMEALRHE